MSNPKEEAKGLSRRSFLRAFGFMSGAAAVAPLSGGVSSAVAKDIFDLGGSLKVGVIVKRGSAAVDSILSGMNLHLKQISNQAGGRKVQLVVEEMTNSGSLLTKTRKLVESDKCDLVIAHVSSRATASVKDYVKENSVVFIEMNAGETMPSASDVLPTYFSSTLNLWQANAAMGAWAAETIGKTAAIHTSFSNSGFDFHSAFALGFESNGGKIVSRIVTGAPESQEHPMSAIAESRKAEPSVIYASYSEQLAGVYSQAYTSSAMSAPLLGIDHSSSQNAGTASYAASWAQELSNNENKAFIDSYASFTGEKPNAFAVLGYDTMRFALAGARNGARGSSMASNLVAAKLEGPRGTGVCNPLTHALDTPLYLCSKTGEIAALDAGHAATAYASLDRPELRGGWLNAYTSV